MNFETKIVLPLILSCFVSTSLALGFGDLLQIIFLNNNKRPAVPNNPNQFVDGSQCARSCDNTSPMNCDYTFKIENFYSMSKACYNCPEVLEDCFREDCIIAAGEKRPVITANRQIPGPTIDVCRGDTVRILVQNNLIDAATVSLHWHGIFQEKTPYMDGVPFVTQCPIDPSTNFTYQFKITQSGTFMWHGHNSMQRGEGLFGKLISREPAKDNPHINLYDYDKSEHVIILMDWSDQGRMSMYQAFKMSNNSKIYSTSILVNGFGYKKDQELPLANFEVEQGKRYRFRVISVDFANCPLEISIDNHPFSVIAADASDIQPIEANTFMIHTGERYDIVINANQPISTYWIRLKAYGFCSRNQIIGLAILRYKGSTAKYPPGEFPDYSTGVKLKGTMINHQGPVDDTVNVINTAQFRSVSPLPKELGPNAKVTKFYMSISINRVETDTPYNTPEFRPQMNHITYKQPGVLLYGAKNLDGVDFCNWETRGEKDNCTTKYCECTQMIEVEKGAAVEFIYIGWNIVHPIHLHGNDFYVLSWEMLNSNFTRNDIIRMDQEGKLIRNFDNPPLKDTLGTPPGGYAVIRFLANFPGFWYLHCHLGIHTMEGMSMIVKVGETWQMPKVPENFPTCDSFYN